MVNADVSSQEKAYRYLKAEILDLGYKPNERLNALEIAEHLEISRTPVREALGRLEQEGLVVGLGGGGYTVRVITIKEAMELYRVREVLEVAVMQEVIPNVNQDLIEKLRGYLNKAEESLHFKKLGDFRSHTRAFHRAIANASKNSILVFMLSQLDDRIRLLGALTADRFNERPREALHENLDVLRALSEVNEEMAIKLIRKHVTSAKERFLKYVTSESIPLMVYASC
jgi:DNA-binding GntR family transcriptional regulator